MTRLPWLMRALVRTYCFLLRLYPRAFRRQFGPELIQVFTTECREVLARAGSLGLARMWWPILGDLIVTALAEHWSSMGETIMSRRTWIQWGGFSLMAASLLGSIYLLLDRSLHFDGSGGIVSAIWDSAIGILLLLGVVGVHALLADAPQGWRWVSMIATSIGLALVVCGNVFIALNLGETVSTCGSHCSVIASSNLDIVYPLMKFLGALSISLGVLGLGVLMQQRQPLAWWGNLMPWVIDSVVIAVSFLHLDAREGIFLLAIVWSVAVFILGRALWRAGLVPNTGGATSVLEAGN